MGELPVKRSCGVAGSAAAIDGPNPIQARRGVICLADDNYFFGVRMLYHSLAGQVPSPRKTRPELRRTVGWMRIGIASGRFPTPPWCGPCVRPAGSAAWPRPPSDGLWICPN